jgi:molybdate transport system permease protein
VTRVGRSGDRIHPVVAVLAIAGVVFVLLPVVGLVVRAPWAHAASALRSNGGLTALRLSLVVSVSAAALSMVLGLPVAWVLARGRVPGRAAIRALVVLPVVLPPVVGGIGLLAALGRAGLVGRFLDDVGIRLPFTTPGAVVAATFVSMPLLVIAAESGFRSVDRRLEGAATTFGGSRAYVFRRVTLPLVAPQLAAGATLAWARALGEFGATVTFAGNLAGRTQTLPLAVYQARESDPGAAMVLSLVLVVLSLIVLIALRHRLLAR